MRVILVLIANFVISYGVIITIDDYLKLRNDVKRLQGDIVMLRAMIQK